MNDAQKIARVRSALMTERDTLAKDPKNSHVPGAAIVNARAVSAINDYLDNASRFSLLRFFDLFRDATVDSADSEF